MFIQLGDEFIRSTEIARVKFYVGPDGKDVKAKIYLVGESRDAQLTVYGEALAGLRTFLSQNGLNLGPNPQPVDRSRAV